MTHPDNSRIFDTIDELLADLNALENPSFENIWITDPVTGNQTPLGWGLHIRAPGGPMLSAGAFPGESDPFNTILTEPECVHKLASQLPPNEQPGGEDALILDGSITYKVFGVGFSATLSQSVPITPGSLVTFRVPVQVHHHGDGSWGACAFRIFIDGHRSQWATFEDGLEDREWVYITASAVIPASSCTVGLDIEGRAIVPVSFFVDALNLEITPPTEPPPGVDYVVTVELLPQDFTLDEIEDVVERTFEQRRTFLQSADDAVRLVVPGLPGSRVDVWEPSRFYGGDIVQWLHDRGVEIVDVYYLDGGSPPPPPPPDWTPRRYIPTGLTVGFMGLGNCGLPQLYNGAGVTAPTIKLQQAIWDIGIMPAQFRTVRLDDWPPLGYRFSGFDYLGDPIAQAETRMSQLLPLLEPLRGQFEFLEYVNEANPPHDRPELAANIARFSMRAMDIAEAAGWKLANLSFSTGEPTHECWDVIAQTGFLERCAAGGHAIALHAYLDHRVPGDITHHLCRYRYLWDNHVLPRRLNIPMLLTELGPWRHLLTQIDALGFVTAVDNELRRDPYATGQLYTVSDIGTEEDYDRFWRNAYARFIRYAESVKDRANG